MLSTLGLAWNTSQWQLYRLSRPTVLYIYMQLRLSVTLHSAFLKIQHNGVCDSAVRLCGRCHVKLLLSPQCHFIQCHRMHVCLAVTCHLQFCQNDQDLLNVCYCGNMGEKRIPKWESVNTKSGPGPWTEKKIIPLFLPLRKWTCNLPIRRPAIRQSVVCLV